MSDIGVKELRQIKGLGPKKAELIASTLSDETTIEDLRAIKGVSDNLAKQVIELRDAGGEPVKSAKRTRKSAAKATASKSTARASNGVSNGRIILTAGTLRKVARAIETTELDEATRIRNSVADLLDTETVPAERFA